MKVLAIGRHPDDLEIACGGTLRKYVEEGSDVYMCHVANGNMGHVEILPEPLREIRTIESEAAGKIIGAKKVFNLDVGDVTVTRFDNDVVDAMADVVREVRPDVIITHNDEDYMQDHVETSRIAFNRYDSNLFKIQRISERRNLCGRIQTMYRLSTNDNKASAALNRY